MPDFASRRVTMVDTQVRPSDVTQFPIIEAMLNIPREVYVPAEKQETAYLGENMPLGNGRYLLEPRTFSKMLNGLNLRGDELVLDLGCGLGYSTAVIAHIVEAVVALEVDAQLANEAETTLGEQGVDNAAVINAPLFEGAPKHGPYDAIMVEGAIERFPDALSDQLKEGGRVAAVFAENELGVVRIGHKIDGQITWRYEFNASAPVLDGFGKETEFAL
ncbi:protein-L-isoaspartate O-methyltransferase family protein [Qingshengfaniella alkalisoli]|uniref:Protein-L-isoaspartate O-methyltransferase n=1 Tax=Qingshengfaniella alkalisoli TaxID=2599296 RepID=A0A5B8I7B4_9RHOB|nr:protein-L-isoaspartate O-methyltransferase [Qingshengfaniella alkalisoli]QDY69625.1 protein-L-isoaspartate O-methyltransferase [Qingshengfaniella alkalisoli]